VRSSHLIIAALVISAAAIGVHEWDELSFDVTRFAAYAAFFLNAAVGIAGLWTAHRFAWVGYLLVSIAGMVLIGSPTPVSALWLLTELN
jgi:hypothetical protein